MKLSQKHFSDQLFRGLADPGIIFEIIDWSSRSAVNLMIHLLMESPSNNEEGIGRKNGWQKLYRESRIWEHIFDDHDHLEEVALLVVMPKEMPPFPKPIPIAIFNWMRAVPEWHQVLFDPALLISDSGILYLSGLANVPLPNTATLMRIDSAFDPSSLTAPDLAPLFENAALVPDQWESFHWAASLSSLHVQQLEEAAGPLLTPSLIITIDDNLARLASINKLISFYLAALKSCRDTQMTRRRILTRYALLKMLLQRETVKDSNGAHLLTSLKTGTARLMDLPQAGNEKYLLEISRGEEISLDLQTLLTDDEPLLYQLELLHYNLMTSSNPSTAIDMTLIFVEARMVHYPAILHALLIEILLESEGRKFLLSPQQFGAIVRLYNDHWQQNDSMRRALSPLALDGGRLAYTQWLQWQAVPLSALKKSFLDFPAERRQSSPSGWLYSNGLVRQTLRKDGDPRSLQDFHAALIEASRAEIISSIKECGQHYQLLDPKERGIQKWLSLLQFELVYGLPVSWMPTFDTFSQLLMGRHHPFTGNVRFCNYEWAVIQIYNRLILSLIN